MKLAIFAHVRSGSTMLYEIIHRHLEAANLIEKQYSIPEPFTPHSRKIISSRNGYLEEIVFPTATALQLRPERLKLFRQHLHQDYIIKLMSQDAVDLEIMECINTNYNVIAIERRNVMSAYFSALIAHHYQLWYISDENQKPEYRPFVVPHIEMMNIGKQFSRYYHWRDKMNPKAILYYEDIVAQSEEDTLRQAEVYQEGIVTPPSCAIKFHSFQEKMDLIENLEEVGQYFAGILTANGIDMECNDL